ncbi:hypothetical protein [Rhodococcus sp. NPDC058521]|uniref:hypothetical protein n=1 Tax=Rhodococcus sp. NPDC058521 TaxID=3346536 RepID=UPI00364FC3D2
MQFGIFTVGDVTTDPTLGRVPTEHELFRAQVSVMRGLSAQDTWDQVTQREYDVLFNLSLEPDGQMRLCDLNRSILLAQPSLSRIVERLELSRPDLRSGKFSGERSGGEKLFDPKGASAALSSGCGAGTAGHNRKARRESQ